MLSIRRLHGGGLDVCDIRTCSGLGDGDTDADLAGDERCDEPVAQLLVAELDDGGDTEGETNSDGSRGSASSTSRELRGVRLGMKGGRGRAYLVDVD